MVSQIELVVLEDIARPEIISVKLYDVSRSEHTHLQFQATYN